VLVAYRCGVPTLSEVASKQLLRDHGVRFADECEVVTAAEAGIAAEQLDQGDGVAVKLCGDAIAHKTERGLVKLNLRDGVAVEQAARDLLAAARPEDGPVTLLVAPMLKGNRELIAGIANDPQFGKAVMLGVGGVLAEAIADVVFRLVPLSPLDAQEMIEDLATQQLLGAFRGEPEVDRDALATTLLALSDVAMRNEIQTVDVNPLIVVRGVPIAVDALVEVHTAGAV
jgi:acetate---CoA ligase (ADP-forming) subunit beta